MHMATTATTTTPTTPPGIGELDRFVSRRELAALEGLLTEGEVLRYAVEGLRDGKRGVLAATDLRILFVAKAILRTRVESWDYDQVAGVESHRSKDDATLTLATATGPVVVTGVRKAAAEGFQAAVRPDIADREFRLALIVGDPRNVQPAEGNTTHERLRRLERMRTRRSITEPEYKVNRRRILEDAGMPTDLRKRAAQGSLPRNFS